MWWKYDKNNWNTKFKSKGRKLFLRLAEIVIYFSWKFSCNLVCRICVLPDLNEIHDPSLKKMNKHLKMVAKVPFSIACSSSLGEDSWATFRSGRMQILKTKFQENCHEKKWQFLPVLKWISYPLTWSWYLNCFCCVSTTNFLGNPCLPIHLGIEKKIYESLKPHLFSNKTLMLLFFVLIMKESNTCLNFLNKLV